MTVTSASLPRFFAALLALLSAPAVATSSPRFHGRSHAIDAPTRAVMTSPRGSWRVGCPVPLAQLSVLEVDHWGFDGAVHSGRLVVNRAHAGGLLGVFRALFDTRFPIERMELVDAYDADDHRSMAANNTSAFNCREVSGRPGVWSQHAYGLAIDVNPVQNPYVSGTLVSPPGGRAFADRSRPATGLIDASGAVVRAFARAGWSWGGRWRGDQDYQHFSPTGH